MLVACRLAGLIRGGLGLCPRRRGRAIRRFDDARVGWPADQQNWRWRPSRSSGTAVGPKRPERRPKPSCAAINWFYRLRWIPATWPNVWIGVIVFAGGVCARNLGDCHVPQGRNARRKDRTDDGDRYRRTLPLHAKSHLSRHVPRADGSKLGSTTCGFW